MLDKIGRATEERLSVFSPAANHFGCFCGVQHYACVMQTQFFTVVQEAANDAAMRTQARSRTVPIPQTLHTVPGYPNKLAVFRIAASKYWQVRCWHNGRTHRQSTKTTSLRNAQGFARQFYELLLIKHHNRIAAEPASVVTPTKQQQSVSFGAMAAQTLINEEARQARGEFCRGSMQVMRNRMNTHILPRWSKQAVDSIDYTELLNLTQFLSQTYSTITVSQYLIVVRKVLTHAVAVGAIAQLPQFPKIKITTNSRGAFTPTEYVVLLKAARAMRGQQLQNVRTLRKEDQHIPNDLAWVIAFMVNAFIRPSDLKTLKHRHVEVVRSSNTYLRLTLPTTKKHDKPIVTLTPAVRILSQIQKHNQSRNLAAPDDYLFLPHLQDREYAGAVLGQYFNHLLYATGLKQGANAQARSLYSLRHSAITFRLLYGQGIDVITLARNARTSIDVINKHYASSVTAEQNIGMLQSRRDHNARS